MSFEESNGRWVVQNDIPETHVCLPPARTKHLEKKHLTWLEMEKGEERIKAYSPAGGLGSIWECHCGVQWEVIDNQWKKKLAEHKRSDKLEKRISFTVFLIALVSTFVATFTTGMLVQEHYRLF